jgi:hypothetical protein
MTVSRWERDVNRPEGKALLTLGKLAKHHGMDAFKFWEAAGLSRADAARAIRLDRE